MNVEFTGTVDKKKESTSLLFAGITAQFRAELHLLKVQNRPAHLVSFSHLWSISSCQPSGGLSCQALK